MAIVLTVASPDQAELSDSILVVLQEWGQVWMWKSLKLIGDVDWLTAAIRDGTCIAVTNGSYIKELYPNMCSCAFVLECTQGRGRIIGSFPKQSKRACAYRGNCLV